MINRELIKALVINLLAMLFWVFVSYIYAPINVILTFVCLPLVAKLAGLNLAKKNLISIYSALCFINLLFYDQLQRVFSSGMLDDAAMAIDAYSFLFTLVTLTIVLLSMKVEEAECILNGENKYKIRLFVITKGVSFIVVLALFTFAVFFYWGVDVKPVELRRLIH